MYVGGFTYGDLGGQSMGASDALVLKLDSQLNLVWARQMGSPSFDGLGAIALDGQGNVYATGTTHGSLDGPLDGNSDAFTLKYTSAGDLAWVKQLKTQPDELNADEAGFGIAVSGDGVYISGRTIGHASVGDTRYHTYEMYLVKYALDGTKLLAMNVGSGSGDGGEGAFVASNSTNVFLAGATNGAKFGEFIGNGDIAVLKYTR